MADNYMTALIGSESSLSRETPEPEVSPEPEVLETAAENLDTTDEAEPEEPAAPEIEASATVESLIEQFAKEHGLNPQDPRDAKVLKRLADKELYIQELRGKEAAPADDGLTEFERQFLAKEPAKQETPQPERQPTPRESQFVAQDGKPVPYGDGYDHWKNFDDGYREMAEAMNKGDLHGWREMNHALFVRQADRFIRPAVEQRIREELQAFKERELRDVQQTVQSQRMRQAVQTDIQFAIQEVRSSAVYKDFVDSMDKPIDETQITINGEKVPNTPINQVIAKHPSIAHYRAENDPAIMQKLGPNVDQATLRRLTFIGQYKLAAKAWRDMQNLAKPTNGIPPKDAGRIFKAGVATAKASEQERARQGITRAGSSGGSKPARSAYDDALFGGGADGELSLSQLMRKQ